MPVNYDAVIPSRASRDVKPQRQSLSSSQRYLHRPGSLQQWQLPFWTACESSSFLIFDSSFLLTQPLVRPTILLFLLPLLPSGEIPLPPALRMQLVSLRTTWPWEKVCFSNTAFTVGVNVAVNSSNIFTASQKTMPVTFLARAIF